MKKAFLILALVASIGAQAQKKDTTAAPPVTDSTLILSISDVIEFDQLLKQKFTVAELQRYDELFRWWQARIRQKVQAYESRKPKGGK